MAGPKLGGLAIGSEPAAGAVADAAEPAMGAGAAAWGAAVLAGASSCPEALGEGRIKGDRAPTPAALSSWIRGVMNDMVEILSSLSAWE